MVRKPVVFGLVLLTLGGLLAGCSSTNDGSKEGPSSSASSSDKVKEAVSQFKQYVESGNNEKAARLVSDASFSDGRTDVIILPASLSDEVTGTDDGKVNIPLVTLSLERRYLDATYTLGDTIIEPGKTYSVAAGKYEGSVDSPHQAFVNEDKKSITLETSGKSSDTDINQVFFESVSTYPKITDATASKIAEQYQDKKFDATENDIQRDGITIQGDGNFQVTLPEDGITGGDTDVVVPTTLTYDATTNEWSNLR